VRSCSGGIYEGKHFFQPGRLGNLYLHLAQRLQALRYLA
jgi:hypothetical protein